MERDWKALMWQQSGCLADTIDALGDADFDHDSLCEGWRVRDVMGHMLVGHTYPISRFLGPGFKARFNIDAASASMSRQYGDAHTPEQIREAWRDVVGGQTRRGVARMIPYREGFVDHFIHEQDIRRPLGLPTPTDQDRLVAALDATVAVKGPMFAPGKKVKGLRLEATDVDWTHGDGPTVRGTAEAIVMAAAGRTASLDELEGDGVAHLRA